MVHPTFSLCEGDRWGVPVIDPQIYPTLFGWMKGAPTPARYTLTYQQLLDVVGTSGVRQVMLVESGQSPVRRQWEQGLLLGFANALPAVAGIVPALPPISDEARFVDQVEMLGECCLGKVKGFGLRLNSRSNFRLARSCAQLRKRAQILGRKGIALDITLGQDPEDRETILRLIRACKDTRFVLNRGGSLCLRPGAALDTHAAWLKQASACENLSIKLAGFPVCMTEDLLRGSRDEIRQRLWDHLSLLVESFGIERCLWGSGWPIDSANWKYEHAFGSVLSWADSVGLATSDRTWLFGKSAETVYQL